MAKKITRPKYVIYDFDGVMTDNRVWFNQQGEEWVSCNRTDGLHIHLMQALGLDQRIISRDSGGLAKARAEKLGIACYPNLRHKAAQLKKWQSEGLVDLASTLYVGNDLNDFAAMSLCRWRAAPSDAVPAILKIANIRLKRRGGDGAIAELAYRLFSESELIQMV